MRSLPTLLAVGICVSTIGHAGESPPAERPVELLVRQIGSSLGIQFEPCKQSQFAVEMRCSKIDESPGTLRHKIDALILGSGATYRYDWSVSKKTERKIYFLDGHHLTVTFLPKKRELRLDYPTAVPMCSAERIRESDDAWVRHLDSTGETTPIVTNPELIDIAQPRYPETARVARLEASVVLNATIETDGHVTDLCVARTDRPNIGFELAAIEGGSRLH